MPPVSKQKLKARKTSQVSVNARKATQYEKRIQDINEVLIEMDDDKLQLGYQSIVQPTNIKKMNQKTLCQKLIDRVKQLSDDQLKSAIHLLDTMRYSKGPNEGIYLFLQVIQCRSIASYWVSIRLS
ncbi:40828_t:CDS:2 [Gigaspora margarita]|uniref:40828_t:CDS:1 n=1 Tax=Gigaspora margarita TaxID=4874 RepID=A0ABN7V799_GIGMA|nr:40828_t:CDS:2 [Gigaspora margarita]